MNLNLRRVVVLSWLLASACRTTQPSPEPTTPSPTTEKTKPQSGPRTNAEQAEPPVDSFEANWRQAREYYQRTENEKDSDQRKADAEHGLSFADKAIEQRANRVEGHYYRALHLSTLADVGKRLSLVKPMVAAADKAREIDETFDDAGPLLFLGKTYLDAPGWPVSIGDDEKGRAYLERAVKVKPSPLAHYFLGQAYLKNDRYADAAQQLQIAVAAASQQNPAPAWKGNAEKDLSRAKDAMD